MPDTCAAPDLMRKWRDQKKLSQMACAELVGVRQNTWSDWENGRKQPHIAQALRIEDETGGAVPVRSWAPRKRSRRAA